MAENLADMGQPNHDAQTELATVPPRDQCVLRYVLERQVQRIPDQVFAVFDNGVDPQETWTYQQCLAIVRSTAAGFQALGVGRGDHVLCWTRSSKEALRVWFALNHIGAVYVPINSYYRGEILAGLVKNAGARLIVMDKDFADVLAAIPTGALTDAVFLDGAASALGTLRSHPAGSLDSDPANQALAEPDLQPWDTQSVMYTSGTTGPSKGVLSSYAHLHSVVDEPYYFLSGDDRYLCNLPLFHVGGMLPIYAMLIRGGSVIVSSYFKTDAFWDAIDRTDSTVCTLLSGMATLLMKQPESQADRHHALKKALIIPLGETAIGFADRFGTDVYTIYHMTEICAPLVSDRNPGVAGLCGRPRKDVSVRLVDAHDCEVEPGSAGELLVRARYPWTMSHGYLNNPAAMATSWLNGWFHTGDVFRVDGEGNFIFVDRVKDVIRRRGENISSFEVEREICIYPAIQDAAAIAVPDRNGEDEVLVVFETRPGAAVDFQALIDFVEPRLPRFMLPRYLLAIPCLPKTPTGKVQKSELRLTVSVENAWDRLHERSTAASGR